MNAIQKTPFNDEPGSDKSSFPDSALDALPLLFDGRPVDEKSGWRFPEFDGDARFWVKRYFGKNEYQIARINGHHFAKWPGFGWHKTSEAQGWL